MHEELLSRIKKALLEAKEGTAEDVIRNEIAKHSEKHATLIPSSEAKALEREAKEWLGHGFLETLLADDNIEEIAINGIGESAYAYRKGKGWEKRAGSFATLEEAMDAVNKLARGSGKRITHAQPRLDCVLENGERMHAAIAPIAQRGASMSIRKFRSMPWTMSDLVGSGTISKDAAALAWALAARNASIVIAGSAGSGKTSFLNALLELLPENERVITVEDAPEIALSSTHRVALVSNRELGVSLHDLVYDSMRMRPDRVVVGEVRSASEARAFFDSLLSGQAKANYCTFHASSGARAMARFAALGATREELEAVDAVIILQRKAFFEGEWKEKRVVQEIYTKEGIAYAHGKGISTTSIPKKEIARRAAVLNASRREREALAQEETS